MKIHRVSPKKNNQSHIKMSPPPVIKAAFCNKRVLGREIALVVSSFLVTDGSLAVVAKADSPCAAVHINNATYSSHTKKVSNGPCWYSSLGTKLWF